LNVTYELFEERLKKITVQLVSSHQRGETATALSYARQAGFSQEDMQLPSNRLFMRVIQQYHPDKGRHLWDEMHSLSGPDVNAYFETRFSLLPEVKSARTAVVQDYAHEEEYSWDSDDFGYGEYDRDFDSRAGFEDEYPDGEYTDEDGETGPEVGFTEAFKKEIFGNLDLHPTAADAASLEGELILAGYGINDLSGIEYCVHISALNLSHNDIQNVNHLAELVNLVSLDLSHNLLDAADELAGLIYLEELDISANDIDDISFLLPMKSLKFVNLTGNPVRGSEIIPRLEKRGVIVLL